MTKVMDIMEDFLKMMQFKYLRLDGGTKTDERAGHVQQFNAKDSDIQVFILSTRAGGLGLNLQTADTVIMSVLSSFLVCIPLNCCRIFSFVVSTVTGNCPHLLTLASCSRLTTGILMPISKLRIARTVLVRPKQSASFVLSQRRAWKKPCTLKHVSSLIPMTRSFKRVASTS